MGLAGTMNARIVGSGQETVILSHGYGGNQSVWDQILPDLTQNHSVLVFDWNYLGGASGLSLCDPIKYSCLDAFVNDLIDLIDEMKLKTSVFIGHSISGMIGCLASIKRPLLFNKLILINSSPRYLNSEGYEGGFGSYQVEQILSSIESNFQSWASNFASLAVGPDDPISVDKFEKSLLKMKPETALSMAQIVFSVDHRDVLEKVQVPCTIIQSSNDVIVPINVAYYMQKKIKAKSTVEIIDSSGHFPQLTVPKMLIDVLDGVLGCDMEEKNIC